MFAIMNKAIKLKPPQKIKSTDFLLFKKFDDNYNHELTKNYLPEDIHINFEIAPQPCNDRYNVIKKDLPALIISDRKITKIDCHDRLTTLMNELD